ncbi:MULTISPECIES: hypothetical protein [unclassified Nostoc]|uniref:hypothetical protein n=1 Tax=unclassified Nostoc TaxID=2593658 RepID=UPI002AD25898|nr:hypothetical protein [Nostoc sp. DedQUE03]MDZ7974280.1 hypothetical protein [Nostoc sp. DedQUE03]MDZ8043575.1 hypothetical protein [Nostoc sp. DedQUE02]
MSPIYQLKKRMQQMDKTPPVTAFARVSVSVDGVICRKDFLNEYYSASRLDAIHFDTILQLYVVFLPLPPLLPLLKNSLSKLIFLNATWYDLSLFRREALMLTPQRLLFRG